MTTTESIRPRRRQRIVPCATLVVLAALVGACAHPAAAPPGPAAPPRPEAPVSATGNGTSAAQPGGAGVDAPGSAAAKPPAPVIPPGTAASPGPAQPRPAAIEPPAQAGSAAATRAPAPQAGSLLTPALRPATFADLPGWNDDDVAQAWPALLHCCSTLRNRVEWRVSCDAAARIDARSRWAIRNFFTDHFRPYRVRAIEGPAQGLVTGYYEPLLRGSRTPHGDYTHALYAPPDDLIALNLASFVPDAQADRVRGRVAVSQEGKRNFVPYYTRAELMNGSGAASLRGKELVWVSDPIEAFFLQVQGSGRVLLDDGSMIRLGYADTNGQPYRSIGRWLVEHGEMKLEDASMQAIQAWVRANPQRLDELLAQNPSYVFFRESTVDASTGPLGSLGVPLTPERSIAVDPRHVPLGAPVWLATTQPMSARPLRRLVLAQDTGSAIKGAVRADLYWGSGAKAGEIAGRTKQRAEMWVLLPKR